MELRIDKTEIEDRALKVRQEHNIQTYGVKDIFSLIQQRNIYLIRYPFGKNVLLGFSTIFEGKKVIVSNSSEILSREIFTIAHELGHIIYDFEDNNQDLKIDLDISEIDEDISEGRAFHFANCFLMPEEQLAKFIKFELKKKQSELTALDIVRIQIEFNVSYNAIVKWLHEIGFISNGHKNELFNRKHETTSATLFRMIDADEKLLLPSNITKVPAQYYEFVISNYENNYIPFSSLENALNLLGADASIFKKEDFKQDEDVDIDDIFEEYE
ncbi:ImmA/IrrE family metallo-endopeptidase [Clostridium thailandense]|uniref:ImmA/IrrE family metallo-endopeptidase n=1 Tax=Clostridium thailandense TaxID=2794346 RepID=UPI003988A47E